jgi:hypothetical protein
MLEEHRFIIKNKHGEFEVIIDTEDRERVEKHSWSLCKRGNYVRVQAAGKRKNNGKTQTKIRLHRFIMNLTDSNIHVDHINNNPLDNRKSNLRLCSHKENMRNINTGRLASERKNKTGYVGVYRNHKTGKYRACISINNKTHHIEGNHLTAEEAAKARDEFVKQHFPKFGKLNFPTGGTDA